MKSKYQDVYPSDPIINSVEISSHSASELLTLEYFEAEPASMPTEVFSQHHILINLKEQDHRVENWRNGEHRDFIFKKNEIVVTPAGLKSGWKWHEKSKVIVITLDPTKFEKFAQQEVGLLLNHDQLKDIPQFIDEDITDAGKLLLSALQTNAIGSALMYESLARVFLIKLIQKYAIEADHKIEFSQKFTSKQYKKVLDYVAQNFERKVSLDELASKASLSSYHFSRIFKQTIGESPHQFVINYRIEQAKKLMRAKTLSLTEIAMSCGFSDQAHFSRAFKSSVGESPQNWQKKS